MKRQNLILMAISILVLSQIMCSISDDGTSVSFRTTLTITTYVDSNRNGIQDPGEDGLPNVRVKVEAIRGGGNSTASTDVTREGGQTDSTTNFSVGGMSICPIVKVTITPPSGMVSTSGSNQIEIRDWECEPGAPAQQDRSISFGLAPIEATATATPTLTATPVPTATPLPPGQSIIIPQPNILILQPVLAGSVSACDTGLGFINFPLADPLPDLTGKNLEVIINGYKVNCTIAGSRNQVLACSLPPDITFPLSVGTTVDSVQVDSFSFDGAICTHTVPTKEREPNDPDNPVAPNAPNTPIPTPVDCDADPYNPSC